MQLSRSFSTLTALLATATLGLAACSTEPTALARPSLDEAAVALELSSAGVSTGDRVAIAVRFDAATKVAGMQGKLRFDPTRLAYVGQSATEATAVVGSQHADRGELRFTSFDLDGLQGRVALFVFEVKGGGYAQGLEYEHYKASANQNGLRQVKVATLPTSVNGTISVPADAREFSIDDWKASLVAAGEDRSVALRPGDLGTVGLQFGDINYDAAIGLDDYLGIAFAAVGLDEIIVGTDGPSRDVDLVIAGNVFPNNGTVGSPACGTNPDGTRVLDLDDYLGVAFFAVGLPTEPCISQVIPGRSAAPTLRDTLSGAELTVTSGVLTLTNDRVWQIDGTLRIQDGADLVIEPGTRVEGTSAVFGVAIFIERGGQIFANGTQYQPITFTCTAVPKYKQCWGGIFIAGRGTVNLGTTALGGSPDGGCNQRQGEGGGPLYGGCNPADNSGSLSYAVIEYAGYGLAADNELNCLTLAGVGSATDIHHVQCHAGSDDGFEFFGGNLSTHHLVATGNDDDGFDTSFGITGDHQFVIIQADAGASNNDSKAIESDGYEGTLGAFNLPRSSPRLWNFTIIGNLANRTQNSAIHLRRGAGVKMHNSVIAGYEIGVDIDDAITCDNTYGDGNPTIVNTTFIEVPNLGQNDASDPVGCAAVAGSATEMEEEFTREAGRNNQEFVGTGLGSVIGTYFVDAYNTNLPDWRMRTSGVNPILGNTAAGAPVATNYRGAVEAGLGGNIPWYSGWTRPFASAIAP